MARHLLYRFEYDMAGVYELRSRQNSEFGVVDLLARRGRLEHAQTGRSTEGRHRFAGRALILFGLLGGTGLGLSAFFLDLLIIHDSFGVEGLTLSLVLPPLSFLSVPWYALFSGGDPGPLLLGYGAPLAGWLLVGLGRKLLDAHALDLQRVPADEPDAPKAKVIAFRPRAADALAARRGRPGVRPKGSRRSIPSSGRHGQTRA